MAIAAIRVLEEAAQATEPTPLTPAVELALDWLVFDRIAEDHQAGRFVEALTTQLDAAGTVSGYMRSTNMEQMVATWKAEVRRRDQRWVKHGEALPEDPFA